MLGQKKRARRGSRSTDPSGLSGRSGLILRTAIVAAILIAGLVAMASANGALEIGRGRDAHRFEFLGVDYNKDGTSTWIYRVTSGRRPSLSHWVLEVDRSLSDDAIVDASEDCEVGKDPTTGIYGFKFDRGYDDRESRTVSFTLDASYEAVDTQIAIKAGRDALVSGSIPGPSSAAGAGGDNQSPTAADDEATINEGANLKISVLDNDSDADGDNLSIESFTQPDHGKVKQNGKKRIRYTPEKGFRGIDAFTYTISDGNGGTDTAKVTVTVGKMSVEPEAHDDHATTDAGVAVSIDILANDTDSDGTIDPATVDITEAPGDGKLSVDQATGIVTYSPDPGSCGSDRFAYRVRDNDDAMSNEARVEIQILCNAPPKANDDEAIVGENAAVEIDVVVNDIDEDGSIDATSLLISNQPKHGSLSANPANGEVTYKPDRGFCGDDDFEYTIADNDGASSNEARVTITVVCNQPPEAGDDSATTDENTSVGVDIVANDVDRDGSIDPATIVITREPKNGRLSVHPTTGVATYTPDPGSCGNDSFGYTIDDDDGETSREARVDIEVLCDDPPLAIDDLHMTDEGDVLTVTAPGILANDVDAPGKPLFAKLVRDVRHGSLSLQSDGSFVYEHDGSETTSDEFTYVANDSNNDSNVATVSIVIAPTNDEPSAADDDASTDEDNSVRIDVLKNDTDPDGDRLTVDWVKSPASGSAANNGDDVTYTPDPDFHGTDSFAYGVSDGSGGTASATVIINVTARNDPPSAEEDSAATDEDTLVEIDVLSNDSDPDGDSLVITSVKQPSNGDVDNNGTKVVYIPDQQFSGVDTFAYTVSDGNDGQATAKVSVTVFAVNDRPIAQDDSSTTNEDLPIALEILGNDTDPDGDRLIVQSVTQPDHGSVTTNGEDVTYTPNPNFNGYDAFSYVISDGNGGTDTATVQLTIDPVNDDPIAQDDSAATDEDLPTGFSVLGNDADPDGDRLIVQSVTQPDHGSVTTNGEDVAYTPDPDFHGYDAFSYSISDGSGGTDTATVQITIDPVNDDPIAQDDSSTTDEDIPATFDVLGNDTDPDGDSVTIQSVTQPDHGSVTSDGRDVTYVPDPNFHGSDAFSYGISDGNGGTDTATVQITIDPVNDDPIAQDDSGATDEDVPVTFDVLGNDTDPEGDRVAVQAVTQPDHGSVTTDGSAVTYAPNPDVHGSDAFTYSISDGNGGTSTATVQVIVNPVNDDPIAQDDSGATDEDVPVTFDVLGNDTDPEGDSLTIQSVTQPDHGSVTTDGARVTYVPDPGFNGNDAFAYIVTDGSGGTDTATVTIAVATVNDAPVAENDSGLTDEDLPVTLDVLDNDTDPDGDRLIIQSVTQPDHGSVTNDGASVTYVPESDYSGSDTLTYSVSDGNGGTDTATVTIIVDPVNDEPVAQDDSGATDEDLSVTLDVLDNDTDPDGDALTVQSVTQPDHGSIENDGSDVTYIPSPGFNGNDTFSYTVSDGSGGTDTATVTIAVATVNDAPVAENDSTLTAEDLPVTLNVLDNDTDPDGDALTVQSVTQPDHGSVTTDGARVIYTPEPNYSGSDNLTYSISDGNGETDTATVTITVDPVNDEPVAQGDSGATDEDLSVTLDVLDNDTDPDGDALTVQSVTQPDHGSVTSDGARVTYVPDPGFNGNDAFSYTVTDGSGGTDTATVQVSVATVNDAPVAENDSGATDEDLSVTLDVLDNDTDPDGDALTVQSVTQPDHGSVTNDGTRVTYVPNPNFHGSDAFTYSISDGNGGTDTATVQLSIDPVNDEPNAQDDSSATDEDLSVTVDVLGNDADLDGDSLLVQSTTQPDHGSIENNGSDVTYIPDSGFNGNDVFSYVVSDGNGGIDTATVTIAVATVNDPPEVLDDTATTTEDVPVTVSALANDVDPDGDSLQVESATQPSHGAIVLSNASIVYTPAPDFFGTDRFTYTASDGHGGTGTATVAIVILPINDSPRAQDDSSSTSEDKAITLPVLQNDSDPDGDNLAVQAVVQPDHGSAVNNGTDVTYIPDPGFNGTDIFTYTLSDGSGGTDTATVIVSVSATNNPPAAQPDSVPTEAGSMVAIPVLANDSDPDGDFLLIESFSQPANGSVLNARTSISYIPDSGFQGVDTFTYTVSDGNGGTSIATVTVSVASSNRPPDAQDDNAVGTEGFPTTVLVLLNDSDPEGDPLAVESVTQAENGKVSTDGIEIAYTPAPGFSGVDSFLYTVSDGNGGTDTATVFVAVAAVNDPPIAQDDSGETERDVPIEISVMDNDSDPDGESLTIASVAQPLNGTVVNAGQSLVYTPDVGFTGTDTFTYVVADGRGNVATATVTVGVSGEAGTGGATAESVCEGKAIISEVAWAGTAADPRDEWIELRNLGTTPISLDGWELRWRRTHPSTPEEQMWKVIELSGILPASSGQACNGTSSAIEPPVHLARDNSKDPAWFLTSRIEDEDTGFFLLERRHDSVISNRKADLLYDTSQTLDLELSDLGEVIMLVNDRGDIVDTANASNMGRDGWAGGSASTFGTMERIDPQSADTTANWHTNAGIVTHGENSREHLLRATPGGLNSPVFEDLGAYAAIEPTTMRAGELVSVDFPLPRQDRRTTGWPWISVSRPGFTGAAGAGGADDLAGYSFSGRYEDGDRYVLDIGTESLPPGLYVFWVTYGRGKAAIVPIVVTR